MRGSIPLLVSDLQIFATFSDVPAIKIERVSPEIATILNKAR